MDTILPPLIADIFSGIVLAAIAWQDFRSKSVYWFLFPLLALLFFVSGISNGFYNSLRDSSINLAFLSFQFICLYIYFFIRKRTTKIINTYIGIGDLLFLAAICFAFSPVNFIVFYVCSLLLTLLFTTLAKNFLKDVFNKIPLAGMLALFSFIVLLLKTFHLFNPYDGSIAVKILTASGL